MLVRARGEQAEIPHGMLIPVANMLRKQANKLFWRAALFLKGVGPGVSCEIHHFLICHLKNAFLSNWKSADIPPRVSYEVLL